MAKPAKSSNSQTAARTASPRAAVTKAQQQPQRGARSAGNGQKRYSPEELSQKIAERAFLLFERRGCAHGFADQDWIEAEAQVRRELRIS